MKEEEIRREIHVHKQLAGHPNIVSMYKHTYKSATLKVPRNIPLHDNDMFATWRKGCETTQRQSVMALEHCTHGDFFNYIQNTGGVKDLKLLKYLFLQVCRGVDALHTTCRMAHLDIKLENILVSEEGDLKICDFGMVRPVVSENSNRLGTDMYMEGQNYREFLDVQSRIRHD